MAGRILLDACNPALDSNGDPDADATLTFYANGTTTPQAIYTSSTLGTPLANPLSPNAAGQFPAIWGGNLSVYSVKWTSGAGTEITFNDIGTTNNLVTASDSIFVAANVGNQTATGTLAKITYGSELLDPLAAFANSRHTPNVAGYYRYDTTTSLTATSGIVGAIVAFYKNGVIYLNAASVNGLAGTAATLVISGGIDVYMNGSTDYMEVWGKVAGTGTLTFDAASCSFKGIFLHS